MPQYSTGKEDFIEVRWSCLRLGDVYVEVNWRIKVSNEIDGGQTINDKLKESDDIRCI